MNWADSGPFRLDVRLKGGNDTFYGGSGFDALEYYWDDGDSGIVLDVAAGTATDTHGDTDTFSGVERISVGALTHSAVCLDVGLDWIA